MKYVSTEITGRITVGSSNASNYAQTRRVGRVDLWKEC